MVAYTVSQASLSDKPLYNYSACVYGNGDDSSRGVIWTQTVLDQKDRQNKRKGRRPGDICRAPAMQDVQLFKRLHEQIRVISHFYVYPDGFGLRAQVLIDT